MQYFLFISALVSLAGSGSASDLLGNTGTNADVKLPAGIEISAELGPKYPPPAGRTNK
uniref:Uncharacterized protein n=1 Tax=Tetranychus urticae TaxID=32264 RepID=T1KM39_TETUR